MGLGETNLLKMISGNLDYAFYMMRCQKRSKDMSIARLVRKKYPDMTVLEPACEDPNAIHQWCWFKEDVLGDENYYHNHFTLDTGTREEFEDQVWYPNIIYI